LKNKHSLLLIFIIFILFNIPILTNLDSFIYLGKSDYSDIPITHYPNLLFIQKSISEYHQLPLWSNLIFSGYPFAANPLSGLWYLPGLIFLVFSLPIGINISLICHLLLGTYGMYFFLRSLEISEISSIFGSLALFFSAKIYAHIGAGHLSLIYAISWTPYLLLLTMEFKSKNTNYLNYILSGVVWGLIIQADLRWSMIALMIWLFLLADRNIAVVYNLKYMSASLFIGFLSSITSWLPLFEYVSLSTRSVMTSADRLVYSLSSTDLLNLTFPFFEGSAETKLYPGAIILLLSIIGIFLFKHNLSFRKWYLLGLISLILAFGNNIPGVELFYNIPGLSLTRVPSRYIFLLTFSLAIISAKVLDCISHLNSEYKFQRTFFLVPVLVFVILFSIGSILISGQILMNFIWSLMMFSLSFIFIFLLANNKFPKIRKDIIITAILVGDFLFVNFSSLSFKPFNQVINTNLELISKIKGYPSTFRLYSPSYSISQEQGAFWGIHQINGVDPLQLTDYVDFFRGLSGVSNDEYSVTLPAFKTGNPNIDNDGICPNINLLRKLNTKFIVSSFELKGCGVDSYELIDGQYLYEITGEDHYLEFSDCQPEKAEFSIIKYSPNQIDLEVTSCGGKVEFSEINYPGWEVYLNGQKITLDKKSLFRSVNLPEGTYLVKMVFKPKIVYYSIFIQVLTLLFLTIYIFIHKKYEK